MSSVLSYPAQTAGLLRSPSSSKSSRRIKINLTPQQAAFRTSSALFRGFVGGRGAGKTWVGAYDELMRASLTPGLYACYAPTFDMVEQLSMRTLLETGRSLGIVAKTAKLIVTLTSGSEILCRSLDDPEHARGGNFSGCWMDEASLVPRDAFDIVIASLRQAGRQGWLSATFTPKGRQHWTYEVFGQGGPDTLLVRATTRDNPFLPGSFYGLVAGQYAGPMRQQELEGEFIDIEGGLAKREWFPIVDAAPAQARRVRFWDMAATEKSAKSDDPDWTVGTRMAEWDAVWYVEHVVRERVDAARVATLIRQTGLADGPQVTVLWEQEGGSSGKIVASNMSKDLAGLAFEAVPVHKDKVTRAMPFLAQAQAGNVRLVRGAWIGDWLDEMCAFPMGAHDDQVDSASGAFAGLPLYQGATSEEY